MSAVTNSPGLGAYQATVRKGDLVRRDALPAVTQATNTTTAVTLNALKGAITLQATLATDTGTSFTLNNTYITPSSVILFNVASVSATADATRDPVRVDIEGAPAAGSVVIHIHNLDANTTTAAPIIYFAIL